MNATEIIGKEVLDKNANRFGRVVDIDLDMAQGLIDHIIVKIGVTKKVNVPFSSLERAGDKVILKITKEELEGTPSPTK